MKVSENELKFFEFIYERQSIWHKRNILKQAPPWTDDAILRKYKICNCYRELDKGTIHLVENVLKSDLDPADKIFNIILYRRFNVFGFFSEHYLGGPMKMNEFDKYEMIDKFDALKAKGVKLFSDAYTTCQIPYNANIRKSDKHVQILLSMEGLIREHAPEAIYEGARCGLHAEQLHKFIQTGGHRIGPFLAYQIMLDISYMPECSAFAFKSDLAHFVEVGPGAIGGLELANPGSGSLFQRTRELYLNQGEAFCELARRGKQWIDVCWSGHPALSLSNIEACLCEYRKFNNLKNNPKNSRKRYYKGAANELPLFA